MMTGTIQTQVWANMPNVTQEYFRYEVITRWWPVDEKDENNDYIMYKTSFLSIGREGEVILPNDDNFMSNMLKHWNEWLQDNHKEKLHNGFDARCEMRIEHDYAIRLVIG